MNREELKNKIDELLLAHDAWGWIDDVMRMIDEYVIQLIEEKDKENE